MNHFHTYCCHEHKNTLHVFVKSQLKNLTPFSLFFFPSHEFKYCAFPGQCDLKGQWPAPLSCPQNTYTIIAGEYPRLKGRYNCTTSWRAFQHYLVKLRELVLRSSHSLVCISEKFSHRSNRRYLREYSLWPLVTVG